MAAHSKKTIVKISFDTLADELKSALENDGFTVSSVTDHQKEFLEKMNVHYKKYKTFIVHHPHLFLQMLTITPVAGAVLPCIITLMEHYPGEVEVIAFNPTALLAKETEDVSLQSKAEEVSHRLEVVLHTLEHDSSNIPDLVTSWS